MDEKFLSSSYASDPRLQKPQESSWGWEGQERTLVTNPRLTCSIVSGEND